MRHAGIGIGRCVVAGLRAWAMASVMSDPLTYALYVEANAAAGEETQGTRSVAGRAAAAQTDGGTATMRLAAAEAC